MNNEILHITAKKLATQIETGENRLVSVLIEIQERQAYRDLGYHCKGLFTYAVKYLGLTESVAHSYRTVVNHAIKHPELKEVLSNNHLSMAKASKIASSLTGENVAEVLVYAATHSVRETQTWLVREKGALRKVSLTVTTETLELFKDVKNITSGNLNDDQLLQKILKDYQRRHDPVQKAKRSQENGRKKTSRESEKNFAANPSATAESPAETRHHATGMKKRVPLTAAEKHAVNLRDENRCTFS